MADEAPTPSPGMFNPLRPRTHLDQDELGRKGFVRSVWRALRNHDASEAIVISIQAPWGDGKTTLKDMVVQLEEDEGEPKKLLFVHFNPWEWAAQDKIVGAFIHELGAHVGYGSAADSDAERARKIRALLRTWGSMIQHAEIVLTATEVALAASKPEYAAPVGFLRGVLNRACSLIERLRDQDRGAEPRKPESLKDVKRDLRRYLGEWWNSNRQNIVVFIDDIDRLSGDEIRQVLQLVKINADFPGLIFVLLFDKEYVERRLRRHFGSDAGRFLEKIVQVELTLPKASEDQLYGTFKTAVQDALKKRPAYLAIFEEDRLKQAFEAWFQFHLVNPRKSGRLLSSWAFRLDVFNTGAAEVNPVDLLMLEALALYEPAVHRALSIEFPKLFHDDFVAYMDDAVGERNRPAGEPSRRMQVLMDAAKAGSGPGDPLILLKLLVGVPGDEFADPSGDEHALRIRRVRFSHGRFARRYFRLTIDAGDVPKSTIRKLVKTIGTPIAFCAQLADLEAQGVLLDALDQLLAEDIPAPPNLSHFLAHLLDWWEDRITRRGSEKEDTSLEHALIHLYEQLMGTREGKDRGVVLQAMLQQTTAVFALRDLVFHEQGKRHQREDDKSPDTTGLLDKEAELKLCEGVATRLLQHFKNNQPVGRPYENEACRWTLSFGGAWQPDIGKELLRTAGGVATLLRGVLEGFGSLPSVDERRWAAKLLAKMLGAADLYQGVQTHREKLIQLGEDVNERLHILDRIRSASVSREGQEAPENPV
jgi:hypothetical protein